MNKLTNYNKKRNFHKTDEPAGEVSKLNTTGQKEPIFVVQHHIATSDHYDFRLEHNGVLLSWAVPKGPSYNPQDKRLAIMVEDHPLSYALFEGTIPKGEYGGGTVMLWDVGTYEPTENLASGLKNGSIKLSLHGARLMGKWALIRFHEPNTNHWMLLKETDSYAKKSSGITKFKTSIKSDRTMKEIETDEK